MKPANQINDRYRVGTVSIQAHTEVTFWTVFDNGEAMTTEDAAQRIANILNQEEENENQQSRP